MVRFPAPVCCSKLCVNPRRHCQGPRPPKSCKEQRGDLKGSLVTRLRGASTERLTQRCIVQGSAHPALAQSLQSDLSKRYELSFHCTTETLVAAPRSLAAAPAWIAQVCFRLGRNGAATSNKVWKERLSYLPENLYTLVGLVAALTNTTWRIMGLSK